MPTDPSIYNAIQPVQPANPMQTLAQVAQLQNMQMQRQEAQQRIQLGQDELARREALDQQKRDETATTTQGQNIVAPYRTGQLSHDQIMDVIGQIPDAKMKNVALGMMTTIDDKASEIRLRESTAGKNDVEALRMRRQLVGDTSRSIRDVYNYDPNAIDLAFDEFAAQKLVDPKLLAYQLGRIKTSDDPAAAGKKFIDEMITQGEENVTLNRGDVRMTPTGGVVGRGDPIPGEAPKVDFTMYLPLYARDVLKKDVSQLTAGDYTAAKKQYEAMNDPNWHGFAPVPVWTKDGLMLVQKSGANAATATPVTGAGAGSEPGAQVQPQAPAAIREQAVAFSQGKAVFDEIMSLAKKVQREHGVMAAIMAPAERAKAKTNLNNDLALLQSTLRGFSPMIARSLGHTGVLTDVDLERTESLIPGAGIDDTLAGQMIDEAVKLMDMKQKALAGYGATNYGGGASSQQPPPPGGNQPPPPSDRYQRYLDSQKPK